MTLATPEQGKAKSVRRAVAVVAETLGAERVAWRLRELSQTVPQLPELVLPSRRQAADGLPLPPPLLRVQVNGSSKPDDFLRQGKRAADTVRQAVDAAGRSLEGFESVLDFGCGSGRVMRQWVGLEGPQLFGSDYNRRLVDWCRDNLPFASFARNELSPPLPFKDAQFDLVYALSVFTHLTERLQRAWMTELARVIRPGGLLVFTTRGDRWAFKLTEDERRHYDAGELVVRYSGTEGTNLCAAWHPAAYVNALTSDSFEPLAFLPAGLPDGLQDVNVVERR